jgi:hypothetical protein
MKPFAVLPVMAASVILVACTDAATAPPTATSVMAPVAFAKGGAITQQVDFTINDTGMDVLSDGKGIYRDGICGVIGVWSSDIMHLAPAEGSIPKSQKASCTGIAPRQATLRISLKHVSDSPHVDLAVAPTSYGVQNIKVGFGSAVATTVNAGNCGTVGLRFSPITYPGSSGTVRDDLGGGLWHVYTQPWPNNIAYCNNGTVTFWHVSLDVNVQVLP